MMTDWPNELEQDREVFDAWTADERRPQGLQLTQKVAPSFDGGTSWFAYEEAIGDWLDITTLTPEEEGTKPKSKTGLRSQHLQASP